MDIKKLITDLSKICEYMYRKGVYDSGMCGDPLEIDETINRDYRLTTYKMLNEDAIDEKKCSVFIDNLVVISNRLNANTWRDFVLFSTMRNIIAIKKEMATLIDYFYQLGLKDGLTITKDECIEFYESVRFGATHYCIRRQAKLSRNEFIDDMKKYSNDLSHEMAKEGLKSSKILSKLIEEGRR